MRRALQTSVVVLVWSCLIAPWGARADDADEDADKQAAQARKERFTNYMRDFAESTAIRLAAVKGEPEQTAKLVPNPVFRYSDEERLIPDGTPFKQGYSMTQVAMSCPKCHGEMVPGYVLDFTPIGNRVSKWNDGPPKKAGWAGIAGIKDSASQIPISTFRCQSCGFLESYAREEFAAR